MKTTADFKKMKNSQEPIVMLTAYDAPSAKLAEKASVDTILVGDSLGMVVLGYESTVPVTMEDMIHHTKAVKRGARDTFIIADMPFLSYHASDQETFTNARRLIQDGGAHAIKMEGNGSVLEKAKKLVHGGVPVVCHLGLTPQTVGVMGGYGVQGKEAADAEKLLNDAETVEQVGASMLVLECVPESLAREVSNRLSIPVIGIGAGRDTDGQVLVYHDVIGYYSGHTPKFVKQYSTIGETIEASIQQFTNEVKSNKFPEEKHVFQPVDRLTSEIYGGKGSND
ncbi:3-methyl-2-oxobutanoate hydroxymethyltransferase [Salipaludibacillus keqinensis]|uniref:3-methyl-2-oxobutanoate hydroxymethyltransferase n=1 Tax=Salipaludibacillus keqinensis TaxID=2045207 RepID=A0A323TI09_9BACI|nr:3-methyl-2-oxobutanoate hydroxymethyltransferase [Salipaludibacillus keqinensis]PYZ94541.1 3-methyl-2-oxobutanoate hydroxymethyltransferase [Salipaludibacillus keqinensis]